MVLLNFNESVYERGEIVEVNKARLLSFIEGAEEMLNLSPQSHTITLEFLADNEMEQGVQGAYDPVKNIFRLPQRIHEGILLHESVHYRLGKEGLLFSVVPKDHLFEHFYGRLLDETMAEFVAFTGYGYTENYRDWMALEEKVKSTDSQLVKNLIQKLYPTVSSEQLSILQKKLITLDYPYLEIIQRQRAIEKVYKKTKEPSGIVSNLVSLNLYLRSLSTEDSNNPILPAIRSLSVRNAINLSKVGITPDCLLTSLRKAAPELPFYGLYFQQIVERLPLEFRIVKK